MCHENNCSKLTNLRHAFTVLELLVVVVVVAMLAVTLSTTSANVRPGAYTRQCANNLRQLTVAWRMRG
jgi:prepilin-type N-terminal cleavage/methylation domain-containing protein